MCKQYCSLQNKNLGIIWSSWKEVCFRYALSQFFFSKPARILTLTVNELQIFRYFGSYKKLKLFFIRW